MTCKKLQTGERQITSCLTNADYIDSRAWHCGSQSDLHTFEPYADSPVVGYTAADHRNQTH